MRRPSAHAPNPPALQASGGVTDHSVGHGSCGHSGAGRLVAGILAARRTAAFGSPPRRRRVAEGDGFANEVTRHHVASAQELVQCIRACVGVHALTENATELA